MSTLQGKQERLRSLVGGFDGCVVAYSGGVDSALVAWIVHQELGPRAMAVTGVSPSLAASELASAREVARAIGIAHQTLPTQEMDRVEYRRNDSQRCFHCKNELYSRLRELANRLGFKVIANGTNADDLHDYRPGIAAGTRWNVRSPLAEAGISKEDVRNLARQLGLTVADKPASPCLSSRLAPGEAVTVPRLQMVERAEEFLKALNCAAVRVRYHAGDLARIEVDLPSLAKILEASHRQDLVAYFRELGFRFITLDLQGFRSGSLSATIESCDLLPIVDLESSINAPDVI